jgi:hypothetical protein
MNPERSMRVIVSMLCVALAGLPGWARATPAPMHDMRYFVGHWDCAGRFPSSGRKIASTMRFRMDLDGRALVKHHADKPPAGYQAIEAWAYDARDHRFQATVLDNGGGARTMLSEGWHGDTLVWTVRSPKKPTQQFVYVRLDDSHFRLDWMIARHGNALAVGDTLACRRL